MPRVPVAVTGAACLLPGAPNLAAFERLVMEGRSAIRDAPDGRFGIPNAQVRGEGRDRAVSLAGGYVDSFQPDFSGLKVDRPADLDPLVQWLLHCSREVQGGRSGARTGAIFGNLSFPTDGMAKWGQGLATGTDPGDPRNHFMSGLPAAIVAQALGLDGPAHCLDAACASSIYALKLACDALESGRVDAMLAGAVQRADSLFLHVGFTQLGALSPTGQSRPFHPEADGLVPAEGCVVFRLVRLSDALAAGEPILGVIRGIGLSNDGRGRSLLAPSAEGQARAMRAALADAAWSADSVQLFECHATGTKTGDRTELESLAAVYPRGAVGSLKSNFGHLVTTAGAAGLLKVLVAMRAGQMPPTLHLDRATPSLSPFTPLRTAVPWPIAAGGTRRAAVSAFGFGGNNGHLLVESHAPDTAVSAPRTPRSRPRLAVLALVEQRSPPEAVVGVEGLRFPPADLAASLGQQCLLLQAAREAWSQAGLSTPRERLGVVAGMACDGAIGRWGLRWRLANFSDTYHGVSPDAVAPPLRAEHVVGTMPNIVANRVSVQLDAAGPGFTVSAEELSGLTAIDAAWDLLARDELDAVVVGAVDVAADPRAVAARQALGRAEPQADAVVALVLVRAAAVEERRVIAWLDDGIDGPLAEGRPPHHGAAEALVVLADAIHRGGDTVVQVAGLGGRVGTLGVRSGPCRPDSRSQPPSGPVVRVPLRVELPPPTSPPALPPVAPLVTRTLPLPPSLVPVLPGNSPRPAPPVPLATAAPGSTPLTPYTAWRGAVADAHAAFLGQQTALHSAFLDAHARMTAQLLQLAADPTLRSELDAPSALSTALDAPPVAPMEAPATTPAEPVPVVLPPPPVTTRVEAPRPAEADEADCPPFHLSRAELEMGANGSISTIFGPAFAALDAYRRVVRMPEPPLLLADRVIGLEGPAKVLGKGRIITETDIGADAWYLHDGRMPGGLMIESGQADLLLGSWQGIDFLNQGERIYRLLGCTLTYKGPLPGVGDTLRYDIRIDQHAKLGDVRMFFFRYDCHVAGAHRLAVREGQAGFFTDEELRNSGGCIWDAASHDPGPGRVDPPVALPERTELGRADLEAFAAGDLEAAFGRNHARAHSHTWTPRVPGDRMLILDRVAIDIDGGPWKRGYLRAELDIRPDLWFFHGHFHHDPCMPGTLMFDGCLQAMYTLLAARGHTLHRDGWRFEPVKDIPFKLRCRGQVIPSSKRLVYEVFVTELTDGPTPRLAAQVLCTVDGLKCFHADPLVVELVPDWPLSRPDFAPRLDPAAEGRDATRPVAAFGAWSNLLACAWGRPTDAFGPMYADFDGPRKVPRLPGPPYHFMSRVAATTGQMGSKTAGCSATVEYDVPADAWYFSENAHPVMPWAVLLEAALQPCGWLASWSGCAVGPDDFLFRNLDGTATIHREVTPSTGRLTTVTTLDRVSKSGGMILVAFTVTVRSEAGPVVDMKTVFGFFPPEAFVNQVGVGSTEAERARLLAPGTPVALPGEGERPALSRGRLRLLDRVTRIDTDRWRGEKDVSARDWFFAAHFYQDPVQPGSLGIEALVQLVQVAMIDAGHCRRFRRPRFEPTANGEAQTWKYRGQVVPENKLIQTDIRLTEVREEAHGTLVVAEGGLWVDGKRIYAMPRFAMRVVEDERPDTLTLPVPFDHRPTWTLPATPMMGMALHALAWAGASALTDGSALRWLSFPDERPRTVPVSRRGDEVVLGEAAQPFFRCRISSTMEIPEPPPLQESRPDGRTGEALYASGALFHGPAFHAVDRIDSTGANGASGWLRAGLPPEVMLDGMTHFVPHDDLRPWFTGASPELAAYPSKLRKLILRDPLPQGPLRVEVRLLGSERGRPIVGGWLCHHADGDTSDTYHAFWEMEEVLLPKGPIGTIPPTERRAFLGGRYVAGAGLSRRTESGATVRESDIRGSDWLPGTVARVYGSADPATVAAKDAAAARFTEHPHSITIDGDQAWSGQHPLMRLPLQCQAQGTGATAAVEPGQAPIRDLSRVINWWRRLDAEPWPGEGVFSALVEEWLRDFVVHDPVAMRRLDGPVLFCANHENYLESVLFTAIAAAAFDRPIRAVAKVEHQTRWLGRLHAAMTSYPGRTQAPRIVWFDQALPQSLRPTLDAVPRGVSLLVHVEGFRQTRPGDTVSTISSIWADFAAERGMPIVPVAFRGGLNGAKTDLPVAPQTHHIGTPLFPGDLARLPYAARRRAIADAINALPAGDTPVGAPDRIAEPGRALVEAVERRVDAALAAAPAAWAARFRAISDG